jgi:hypothetical protein
LNAIFRERNFIPHCICLNEHPMKDNEITDFFHCQGTIEQQNSVGISIKKEESVF